LVERSHLIDARWGAANTELINRIAKELRDPTQRELSVKETGHGHSIGGDEGAWCATTGTASLQGDRETWEAHKIGRSERQRSLSGEVHVRDG
jgi:hypothetical protein